MLNAIKGLIVRGHKAVVAAFFLLFAGVASADGSFDTAAIVTEIQGTKAPIVAVGTAILGVVAVILAFRMIRKITG